MMFESINSVYQNGSDYFFPGVKLQELTCDKLPKSTGHISIKEDVLAVPGRGDKKFYLFKINR